jgi:hypothetical protein
VGLFADIEAGDPIRRVFALAKANQILGTYTTTKLKSLDIRLLKGFYINEVAELENDSDTQIDPIT